MAKLSVRDALLLCMALVAIAILGVSGVATWYFLLAPAIVDHAESSLEESVRLTAARVNDPLLRVERGATASALWLKTSFRPAPREADLDVFASEFLTRTRVNPAIESMHFASESGRDIQIRQTTGGLLAVRLTDPDKRPGVAMIQKRDAGGKVASSETVDSDYDVRTRDWFKGAMAARDGGLYWSAPYRLFGTSQGGMTVATAVTTAFDARYLVAIDVGFASLDRAIGMDKLPAGETRMVVANDGSAIAGAYVEALEAQSNHTQPIAPRLDSNSGSAASQAWNLVRGQTALSGSLEFERGG